MNNSIRFQGSIEELVQKTKMTYLDAIMFYCEENKLEPETAGKMVGGKQKQNVQEEAELIPKSKVPQEKETYERWFAWKENWVEII